MNNMAGVPALSSSEILQPGTGTQSNNPDKGILLPTQQQIYTGQFPDRMFDLSSAEEEGELFKLLANYLFFQCLSMASTDAGADVGLWPITSRVSKTIIEDIQKRGVTRVFMQAAQRGGQVWINGNFTSSVINKYGEGGNAIGLSGETSIGIAVFSINIPSIRRAFEIDSSISKSVTGASQYGNELTYTVRFPNSELPISISVNLISIKSRKNDSSTGSVELIPSTGGLPELLSATLDSIPFLNTITIEQGQQIVLTNGYIANPAKRGVGNIRKPIAAYELVDKFNALVEAVYKGFSYRGNERGALATEINTDDILIIGAYNDNEKGERKIAGGVRVLHDRVLEPTKGGLYTSNVVDVVGLLGALDSGFEEKYTIATFTSDKLPVRCFYSTSQSYLDAKKRLSDFGSLPCNVSKLSSILSAYRLALFGDTVTGVIPLVEIINRGESPSEFIKGFYSTREGELFRGIEMSRFVVDPAVDSAIRNSLQVEIMRQLTGVLPALHKKQSTHSFVTAFVQSYNGLLNYAILGAKAILGTNNVEIVFIPVGDFVRQEYLEVTSMPGYFNTPSGIMIMLAREKCVD